MIAAGDSIRVAEPMSIATLRRLVLDLERKQPITRSFENEWRKTFSGKSVWYSSQKEHLTGWLFHYEEPGFYNRRNWDRTAEFVYNHINCPPMALWLAEASGVDTKIVRKAAKRSKESGPAHPTMCAALRREIPWPLVEAALLRSGMSQNEVR